jgi:hypothetical protein
MHLSVEAAQTTRLEGMKARVRNQEFPFEIFRTNFSVWDANEGGNGWFGYSKCILLSSKFQLACIAPQNKMNPNKSCRRKTKLSNKNFDFLIIKKPNILFH